MPDAEQLVEQADRQQLTYGAMESKPRDLMARIAAAKCAGQQRGGGRRVRRRRCAAGRGPSHRPDGRARG